MTHLLLVALAAGTLLAADATGTWTGTFTPDDGQARPAYLVLKQEGDKLTGTAGPDQNEQRPIQNGKADNGNVTFEIATEETVMKVVLKQDGDQMVGELTRERGGQTQTAKLTVKRAP
jgi:hypothetical protein